MSGLTHLDARTSPFWTLPARIAAAASADMVMRPDAMACRAVIACHPLPLSKVEIDLALDATGVTATATAATAGQTGGRASRPTCPRSWRSSEYRRSPYAYRAPWPCRRRSKKTSDLIPLCHPLPLSKVEIDLALDATGVTATATAAISVWRSSEYRRSPYAYRAPWPCRRRSAA
jgi:hypothetical protein